MGKKQYVQLNNPRSAEANMKQFIVTMSVFHSQRSLSIVILKLA